MTYFLLLLVIFTTLFLAYLSWTFYQTRRERRLLASIETMPFEASWRTYLEKTVHYPHMSPAERERIERSILRFVWTRRFVGVGIDVTDEMKTVIAFYACMLVMEKGAFCYDNVETVLIYSRYFAAHRRNEHGGIVSEGVFELDGEADPSTIVLSWHDARHEAFHHGRDNVIVHEFAHQLDFADGVPDGIPPLSNAFHARWKRILETDFRALEAAYAHDRDPEKFALLGDYAATDETEFFAVASERFVMRPHALRRHFPELFNLLHDFYAFDPRRWDDH